MGTDGSRDEFNSVSDFDQRHRCYELERATVQLHSTGTLVLSLYQQDGLVNC